MITAEQASEMVKTLPWYVVVGGPIVLAAILAYFGSRISFTKKERADYEQANYANTTKLIEQHEVAYTKYTDSLVAYSESLSPNFGLFKNIAANGDKYFINASLMCDAVLSGKVDKQVRDNTIVPKIQDIASRILPSHYETLREIASKHGWEYSGELRRQDYKSIFAAVEKFSSDQPH